MIHLGKDETLDFFGCVGENKFGIIRKEQLMSQSIFQAFANDRNLSYLMRR